MTLPGYTAKSSLGRSARTYRPTAAATSHLGLQLAQSEVFCGVCALGGFGCGKTCHPCIFDLFECCESICTEPPPGFTAPRPTIRML
jgi:hypothetical protein